MPTTLPALVLALTLGVSAHAMEEPLERALVRSAPAADPQAIRLALSALDCAAAYGEPSARHLTVIDYSLPSTEPRLWVFDLRARRVVHTEWVAHGRKSGHNHARRFSNILGSHESSLGLFRTRHAYHGENGYSLRMDGLETGINDRAAERAIVMHGAPYVNRALVRSQGRIGRSLGCPAVRPEVARALIDTIKDGQYLFVYYPDPHWLATSRYLRCRPADSTDQLFRRQQSDSDPGLNLSGPAWPAEHTAPH